MKTKHQEPRSQRSGRTRSHATNQGALATRSARYRTKMYVGVQALGIVTDSRVQTYSKALERTSTPKRLGRLRRLQY